MNKKSGLSSIEELTLSEISAIENSDKLSKLQKESVRDKRIIAEFKEREKSSARALVLYERKIKYLKQVFSNELLEISMLLNEGGTIQQKFREVFDEDELELTEVLKDIQTVNIRLNELAERLQNIATISKSDREFILNKQVAKPNENETIEERFKRLRQEFSQKIGTSVNRKRGRPKKGEQSIVADIGLGKKPEKKVDIEGEVETKLSEIFYSNPSKNGGQSQNITNTIPQTDDSIFDFNEALNPNISLKDIMADIMSDSADDTTFADKYLPNSLNNKNSEIPQNINDNTFEKKVESNQKTDADLIEAGIINMHVPHIKRNSKISSLNKPAQKKSDFERRFLSIVNVVKENK